MQLRSRGHASGPPWPTPDTGPPGLGFSLSSPFHARKVAAERGGGKGWIDLRIDRVNLMPSRYYLTLWLSSMGGVKYDHLDHCIALDIETADPYGTGKGMGSRFGLVYVTGGWSYQGRTS